MLTLQNISFSFNASKHILDNQSVEFEEEKVHVLLGANGSGKTTFFNLVSGYLRLKSGKITLGSNRIDRLLPYQVSKAGLVRSFQDLRLATKLTVAQNIEIALPGLPQAQWYKSLLPKRVYKNVEIANRIDSILATIQLTGQKYQVVETLSYGQQKLLTLGCAIATGANLLLLDEPVAGINPHYREIIANVVLNLKKQGKTILLIEHNQDFIDTVADRLYFINSGNISQYNTLNELRNTPEVINAYL